MDLSGNFSDLNSSDDNMDDANKSIKKKKESTGYASPLMKKKKHSDKIEGGLSP